jgi:hypothetical protein
MASRKVQLATSQVPSVVSAVLVTVNSGSTAWAELTTFKTDTFCVEVLTLDQGSWYFKRHIARSYVGTGKEQGKAG